MACAVLQNKEPQLTVENMESYFHQRPPDCSLFSEGNFEIKVHREILYQTPYMRDMIKTLDIGKSI